MPEPNPLWGIHVAAGSLAAVCVTRTDDGTLELTECQVERTGANSAGALDAAFRFLGRRGVRGRAAFLALPDASGCLVTAKVPPEDADVTDYELTRELFDHTPFEPGEAQLRFREVETEGRARCCIVSALPVGHLDAYVSRLSEHDFGLLGLGFAGSATLRGARALGLVGEETFLIEVLPTVTHVFAVNGEEVHRYPIPVGEADLEKAVGEHSKAAQRAFAGTGGAPDEALIARLVAAAGALAEDVRTTIEYHREQHRRGETAEGEPSIVPIGALTTSATMLAVLRGALGPLLDVPEVALEPSLVHRDGRPPSAALAGAVGAALEAFDTEDGRLALRPPPEEVPEYRDGPPVAGLAVGALVCAAIAAFFLWGPGLGGGRDVGPAGGDPTPVAPESGWAAEPAVASQLWALSDRAALMRALRGCSQALTEFRRPLVARHLWIERIEGTGNQTAWQGTLHVVATDGAPLSDEDVQGVVPLFGDGVDDSTAVVQDGIGEFSFRIGAERPALESRLPGIAAGEVLDALGATLGVPGDADGIRLAVALRESATDLSLADPAHEGSVPGPEALGTLERALAACGARTITGIGATARTADLAIVTVHASRVRRLGGAGRKLGPEALAQAKQWLEILQPGSPEGRFAKLDASGRPAVSHRALGLRASAAKSGARLAFVEGPEGRVLERRGPSGGAWSPVPVTIPAEAGSVTDLWLPGPSGRHTWRLRLQGDTVRTGDDAPLSVSLPATVTVAPDGRSPEEAVRDGTCRFTVVRAFGRSEVRLVTEPLGPDTPVRVVATLPDGSPTTLTTLYVFEGYAIRDVLETGPVAVPRFRPDGTIERAADGTPVTAEQQRKRPVGAVFVRLRLPTGEVRETRLEK